MAVITKDHAVAIAQKLGARKTSPRGRKAHDLYEYEYRGMTVAYISIRRSSKKDKGHGHLPGDLHLSPRQTIEFSRCNPDVPGYIKQLKLKQVVRPEVGDENDPDLAELFE